MTSAMIALQDDWEGLLSALAADPRYARLARLPQGMAKGVLAAPAAVARWIALRAPELVAGSSLRLLVVGAEKLDAVDGGRWYQSIAALLGRALQVETTLVGDRLVAEFVSPAAASAPGQSAQRFQGSLAEYLATSAGVAHDLALVFHPGFQKHLGWLRDGSLARLIAAGTRVVAASYEYDEAQIDRRVAACHGFSSAGDALVNPFFLELGDARSQIRWGNVLWQLGSPPGERGIDEAGLAKLEQLSAMVMHSIARQLAPTAAYGTEALFSATDGTRRSLIYVFDDYFLDFDTRRLLAFRKGSLDEIGSVSAADVRAYPGPATGDLDRALWAADIKARYLLDAYPEPLDDHAQQRLARSMYAELGARVDAIFKADDP